MGLVNTNDLYIVEMSSEVHKSFLVYIQRQTRLNPYTVKKKK